jgi:hypothetical protein
MNSALLQLKAAEKRGEALFINAAMMLFLL